MLRGMAAAARRGWRGAAPATWRRCRCCCGQAGRRRQQRWVPPAGSPSGVVAYNSRSRSKEPLVLARERVATW